MIPDSDSSAASGHLLSRKRPSARLFSHITMNWSSRPLTSREVIVNSIAATTTRTGLRVKAALHTNSYPTGAENRRH